MSMTTELEKEKPALNFWPFDGSTFADGSNWPFSYCDMWAGLRRSAVEYLRAHGKPNGVDCWKCHNEICLHIEMTKEPTSIYIDPWTTNEVGMYGYVMKDGSILQEICQDGQCPVYWRYLEDEDGKKMFMWDKEVSKRAIG